MVVMMEKGVSQIIVRNRGREVLNISLFVPEIKIGWRMGTKKYVTREKLNPKTNRAEITLPVNADLFSSPSSLA